MAWNWEPDEGYSGYDTIRVRNIAIVVYDDAYENGVQVYDEGDEEATEYGEPIIRAKTATKELAYELGEAYAYSLC